jgi:hypothetical protein
MEFGEGFSQSQMTDWRLTRSRGFAKKSLTTWKQALKKNWLLAV